MCTSAERSLGSCLLWVLVLLVLTGWTGSSVVAQSRPFVRGDVDSSSFVDITDMIVNLSHQFLGSPLELLCLDAADVNDSGTVDITDAIYGLSYLFLGTPPPPPPHRSCGIDPTIDGLTCESFPGCTALAPLEAPEVEAPSSPTRESSILLQGLCEPDVEVVVLGGSAPVSSRSDDSGRFGLQVPLGLDRLNRLAVTAVREDGTTSPPRRVDVIHDGQPPDLFVDLPVDGGETLQEAVTVLGRVADRLSGFEGLEVTVQGLPAEVLVGIGTNGSYERRGVPLAPGANTLRVEARDILGNLAVQEITMHREEPDPSLPQILSIAGDGQESVVNSLLGEALVVEVRQADGTPFQRKLVTFQVTRSDGKLAAVRGGEPSRFLQVRTDSAGRAQCFLRLGSDAGCGNNRVSARSVGVQGEAVFCASARPGPVAQINVSSGEQQTLEVGAPAAEPLRVWASDGCNGVAGVPIRYRVVSGSGTVNGESQIVVETSRTGHVAVQWSLGPEEGEQVVEADFDGNTSAPAVFVATALRRDEASTSFTGFVHDNAEQPLEGARCLLLVGDLEVGEARTDSEGHFFIDDIDGAGAARLFVDGHVVTRVGGEGGQDVPADSYPSLEYDITLIPNAPNSLGRPVVLPRLLPENGRLYDGTEDVELNVDGIEGLRILVKAGSVVLPGGQEPSVEDPITLSLNAVHHDDIPMAMNDGAAPFFAWTLQPHGVRFDPPAAIEYPNISGLAPGALSNFLSFDHDTLRFEIVATGQVSEDGSVIVSDPGVGITKAGWGGNCPPYSVTGEAESCPIPSGTNKQADDDQCRPPCLVEIDGPSCAKEGVEVTFSAFGTPDGGTFAWSGGTPAGSTENPNYTTVFDKVGESEIVFLRYVCPDGEESIGSLEVFVDSPETSRCCNVEILGPTCVARGQPIRFRALPDPEGGEFEWAGGNPQEGSTEIEYIAVFDALESTQVDVTYRCNEQESGDASIGVEVVEADAMFRSGETAGAFLEAAEDVSGDLITPLDRFRFLVGFDRTITVRYCPATQPDAVFRCEVEVVSGGVPANPASGPFDEGGEFTFTPQATPGNRPASTTGIPPVAYRVRVRDEAGGEVTSTVIAQDVIDRVRQEYVDGALRSGASFTQGSVGIVDNAPPRSQVHGALSRDLGGPFGTACATSPCRDGPNPNYTDPSSGNGIVWDQGFQDLVRDVRAAMAPDGVCLHSGHRSPSHNRRVGGVLNSDHQWGKAADMSYECSLLGAGAALETARVNFHLRLYRAALSATSDQVLLEQNATQLLPSRWNPPPASHTFVLGTAPNQRQVVVEDSDGDGLPDRVLSSTPADAVSSGTDLPYLGGGSSNPPFRVVDTNGDGNIDPGEPLRLFSGTTSINLRSLFAQSTHVHAAAN